MDYVTKDSGERVEFESGMRRDIDSGKPRYDLIPCDPLKRLAELYARGAEKYGDRNWELANSDVEMKRFRASAFRHFEQWRNGEVDEDHAIAVVWNIFAFLFVENKLKQQAAEDEKLKIQAQILEELKNKQYAMIVENSGDHVVTPCSRCRGNGIVEWFDYPVVCVVCHGTGLKQ